MTMATRNASGESVTNDPSPLVSVCISAYDVEGFLAEALDSVLGQTYQNLEVVLLDNGSTDRTSEVIQAVQDERLRAFQVSPNLGGYQGMNWTVGKARGDYLAVYHSDDVYEPTIVEREVAFLRSHPEVGAVFALDRYIDEEGRVFGGMTMPAAFRGRDSLTYDEILPYLVNHMNTLFCCPTFMTRRAIWDAIGPFDAETFGIGSDLEMWLRIARRYPVAILNEPLMRYRVRKQNWSARDRRLRTGPECTFPVLDYYLERDGWSQKLSPADLTEYRFHRRDDETARAANYVILRDPAAARELLQQASFPGKTLFHRFRRRKARVLLLRAVLRLALDLGLGDQLIPWLIRTEYHGQL